MLGQKSRTVVPINVCLDAWMHGCMGHWDSSSGTNERDDKKGHFILWTRNISYANFRPEM